ncbi:unnamed protein product [Arctia plantaginis]|uniref:GCF C-terminal domain-containing protein n=1 Tax=Arctia plantaginis TaxID=874455 RepID=A0A8S0YP02_ARCPL|nr:unnamed protein product [Arctia plantaginis]
MSMFRKPKKIQRRMFCADDDEDGDPEPPPPPVISYERKEPKVAKSTPSLSFADEEEEGEVFKVKKSSQSKRLAKRREKEREKQKRDDRTDGDDIKYDNNGYEEKNDDTEITQRKTKKKITLEGLILSGREALAADGEGDVTSGGEDDEEEDSRGFHKYRAETVRAALAKPGIPDAALIHAARKTRQQARELGDYLPLKSDSAPGSRLVRDDGSGDEDEEEGRILVRGLEMPDDKPKRGTAAVSEEELDSETEEWASQQLQKARPAIIDITGDGAIEVNPFSLPAAGPQLAVAAHLRPLTTDNTAPPTSAEELVTALHKRLEELRMEHYKTEQTHTDLRDRLLAAARMRESRSARCAELDAAYRRAQAIRGYLTDLIECLDEKMPQLEALEARALALHKRRCEFLVERRRADLRDQAQDVLATGRGGSAKAAECEEKTRRAAEREGRRRARRLQRESAAAAAGAALPHREGDSSDDDLPPAELHHYANERDAIRTAADGLFADALPAWRSVAGVCRRMARWRARAAQLYADAYVADCLPRLLAPYVRHQLILWNPLADENNEDYEKMDWYKSLLMYGVRSERSGDSSESGSEGEPEPMAVTEEAVRDDPDLLLIPTLMSKVVLPKLTELVECAWDPLCVRACVRVRQLAVRVAALPASRAALRRLGAAARARLAATLAADVFLPALTPQ